MDTPRFETPDFTLTLPAGWTEKPSEDGREFVSADGSHQVIVSVIQFKKVLPPEGRQALVDQLIEARRQAFTQLSGGRGQLLPAGGGMEGDLWTIVLVGADVAAGVLIYARMVATPARVVTASVYRYGDVTDPQGFTKLAEQLSAGLQVSTSPVQTGRRRWLPW
jgi:hypothetical protein